MLENSKGAFVLTFITTTYALGVLYYGYMFLDLIPTMDNYIKLYADSQQTYPEFKGYLQKISLIMSLFGVAILISNLSMLFKFKYSIQLLFITLIGFCVFSYIEVDSQGFTGVCVITLMLISLYLAYQKSFYLYRENTFLNDKVSKKLKSLLRLLSIVFVVIVGLIVWLFSSGESTSTVETMVYEVKLNNGSEYKGKMKDNVPHGTGTMTFPDGKVYTGNLIDGVLEGIGKITLPDGSTYEGSFKNGHPNGKGKMKMSNGFEFEGDFTSGQPNGVGTCFTPDKGTYECNYVEGKET